MAKSKKSDKVVVDTVNIGGGFTMDVLDTPKMVPAIPTQEVPPVPVPDTVADVLGVSGQVPTPEKSTTNGNGKFNLSQAVKSALDKDVNMTRDDVLTFIEDTYGKVLVTDFPDGTFTNTLSVIRKKLKTVDQAIAKDEAGIDPVTALKLCQTLKLTPAALSSLLSTVLATGTVDAVQVGLAKLQELQELMNASSKTAQ